jgi:hypothetical protein
MTMAHGNVFVEWFDYSKDHRSLVFWHKDDRFEYECDWSDLLTATSIARRLIRQFSYQVHPPEWFLQEGSIGCSYRLDTNRDSIALNEAFFNNFKPQIHPITLKRAVELCKDYLTELVVPLSHRGSEEWLEQWLVEENITPMWFNDPPPCLPSDMLKHLNDHVFIEYIDYMGEWACGVKLYFKDKNKAVLCRLASPNLQTNRTHNSHIWLA